METLGHIVRGERKKPMLSEIQGGNIPVPRPVAQPSVVMPASVSTAQEAKAEPVAPKVQAPMPVDIKVDMEKLKANLDESIARLNESMRDGGRNLNFAIDSSTAGSFVVVVKNTDTGEVIRKIPNDAVIRIAHSIDALKGMLHNALT
jgi:flagellar protein FlaG